MYTFQFALFSASVNWVGISFAYNLYKMLICGMLPKVLKLLFSTSEVVTLSYCVFCTEIQSVKRVVQGNF